MNKPKHLGIVASSAEGAALCYRTICVEGAEFCGPHNHPELSVHTHPLSLYKAAFDKGDWLRVGELMLDSAARLQRMGVELLLCSANTLHQGLDLVRDRSPLPWLHIAEVVAEDADQHGYKKLGITGTKALMEGPVYPGKLKTWGIDSVVPLIQERTQIDRFIFDELVYGKMLPSTLAYFRQVFLGLHKAGCDAIVMGCTEIPLLVAPEDSPLPTLDSTRLLARAALRAAVS